MASCSKHPHNSPPIIDSSNTIQTSNAAANSGFVNTKSDPMTGSASTVPSDKHRSVQKLQVLPTFAHEISRTFPEHSIPSCSPPCGEQSTNSGTRSCHGIKSSRELNIFHFLFPSFLSFPAMRGTVFFPPVPRDAGNSPLSPAFPAMRGTVHKLWNSISLWNQIIEGTKHISLYGRTIA